MSEDIANLKIDLHCHTNCSDGDDTPFDLIRNASLKEIKVIGLSDHDNVKALDIAYEATRQFDVKLVAAIEISTPKKIHIQGLGIDPQNEALQELIVSQKKKRSDSLMKIDEALRVQKKVVGAYEATKKMFDGEATINKFSICKYLSGSSYPEFAGRNPSELYRELFDGDKKIGRFSVEWCSMEEAVSCIKQAGGIPVLAHIWRYFAPNHGNTEDMRREKMTDLVERFVKCGGEAMEVLGSSMENDFERNYPAELALKYDLYASCGSDYHGKKTVSFGEFFKLDSRLKPVWEHPAFRFYRK
ncbi:MAG: PHP domain-containing protein [Ruminobacter sp.]|nr:PHP domain-containing protein [Ruminobacter sp.]